MASPTRAELMAHLRGDLRKGDAYRLEHHLEGDPLLREAAEGLALPGAVEGLKELDGARPSHRGRSARPWWIPAVIGGALLLAWTGYLVTGSTTGPQDGPDGDGSPGPATEARIDHAYIPLEQEEITAAVEQPGPLLIGHGNTELHVRPELWTTPQDKKEGLERIEPRQELSDPAARSSERSPRNASRPSKQLHYLYDLKLVHPSEMYGDAMTVLNPRSHANLRNPVTAPRDVVHEPVRTMPYLDFMDGALYKFMRKDHRGCLEDLRFLLDQYPEDVNALFYAGLCSYDLGLYERARHFLHRSATHEIDTFEEESEFYHAMALEQLGDKAAAREAFEGIVARNGFYASRALERLH